MTISSTYSADTYAGDGNTTSFAITFEFLSEATNIAVSLKNDTTEVVTTQTGSGTDYSVSGSNVVFNTAPATGNTVIIELNPSFKQETDYAENSALPAETLEADLDELTLEAQINKDNVQRSIKLDASLSGSVDGTIVASSTTANNADKYVKFNSDGDGFEISTLSSSAGLGNVVEDTSPQLGGDLDTNSNNIQFDDAHGIHDDSGNEQLIFQKTTSAVNHIEITNAATGNRPVIKAAGEADTGIDFQDSDGQSILDLTTVTTPANSLTIANSAAGSEPTISVEGSDTDIGLDIQPKGTGNLKVLGTSTQAGTLELREDTDNGTNFMAIQAPAAVTSSTTLVLPDGDGTADQVLSTDGSANLSWVDISGGKVVQQVTATYGTPETTSSTSPQSSSLAATITPTSTSNKIVVWCHFQITLDTNGANITNHYAFSKIRNTTDGSDISGLARAGRSLAASDSTDQVYDGNITIVGQETAQSTSATTYTLQYYSGSASATAGVHTYSTTGTMIVMEVE